MSARKNNSVLVVGDNVGFLKILEVSKITNGYTYLCLCVCGKQIKKNGCDIKKYVNPSCGCQVGKSQKTHGKSGSPEFRIWCGMIARCKYPSSTSYPYYGGRGITVCEAWEKSFMTFLTDVGFRPAPEYSLDRINPDGNYEPSNCRWATPFEQHANRKWRYMTLRQYQHEASKTAIYKGRDELGGLVYTVLGLCGECGEISNAVKKIFRDGGLELNAEIRKNLIAEAGDVLWYLSQISNELGVTLEDVAKSNLQKLKSRQNRGVIKGSGDNR